MTPGISQNPLNLINTIPPKLKERWNQLPPGTAYAIGGAAIAGVGLYLGYRWIRAESVQNYSRLAPAVPAVTMSVDPSVTAAIPASPPLSVHVNNSLNAPVIPQTNLEKYAHILQTYPHQNIPLRTSPKQQRLVGITSIPSEHDKMGIPVYFLQNLENTYSERIEVYHLLTKQLLGAADIYAPDWTGSKRTFEEYYGKHPDGVCMHLDVSENQTDIAKALVKCCIQQFEDKGDGRILLSDLAGTTDFSKRQWAYDIGFADRVTQRAAWPRGEIRSRELYFPEAKRLALLAEVQRDPIRK